MGDLDSVPDTTETVYDSLNSSTRDSDILGAWVMHTHGIHKLTQANMHTHDKLIK